MPATVLKAAAAGCVCFCVISQHPSVVGSRYFTAPAVIPCDSLRWKMMKKMMPAVEDLQGGKKGKKGKKMRMPNIPGLDAMGLGGMGGLGTGGPKSDMELLRQMEAQMRNKK